MSLSESLRGGCKGMGQLVWILTFWSFASRAVLLCADAPLPRILLPAFVCCCSQARAFVRARARSRADFESYTRCVATAITEAEDQEDVVQVRKYYLSYAFSVVQFFNRHCQPHGTSIALHWP